MVLEGISGDIWLHTPEYAGPPEAGSLGPCQRNNFWISSSRKKTQTQWATCAGGQSPSQWKVFSDVQREHPVFHFVSIASGPGTGHYWKEPGSTFFTPSLQIFRDAGKIPAELSLLQTDQSQLSQPFLRGEMLHSLRHVCDPLLGSLQYVSIFVLLESPEQATALQMWPHQGWVKGWCGLPVLPRPAGNALPKVEQGTICCLRFIDTSAGSCPKKQSPAGWHPGDTGTWSRHMKHTDMEILSG